MFNKKAEEKIVSDKPYTRLRPTAVGSKTTKITWHYTKPTDEHLFKEEVPSFEDPKKCTCLSIIKNIFTRFEDVANIVFVEADIDCAQLLFNSPDKSIEKQERITIDTVKIPNKFDFEAYLLHRVGKALKMKPCWEPDSIMNSNPIAHELSNLDILLLQKIYGPAY
jgi:hypothetical protein